MINSGRRWLEPVRQYWAGQIERVRTSDQSKQANKSRDSRQNRVSNPGSKMGGLVIQVLGQSRRDVFRRGWLYAESSEGEETQVRHGIRVKIDATSWNNSDKQADPQLATKDVLYIIITEWNVTTWKLGKKRQQFIRSSLEIHL